MIRRLLVGYIAITVFLLVLLGWPLAVLYARHERDALVNSVRIGATEAAAFAALPLAGASREPLGPVASRYADSTGGRMVIVDRTGTSVADSHDEVGRSFAVRPEVAVALKGEMAQGFRRSDSLDLDLYFVAVPVNSGGQIVGAVRVTYPAAVVQDRIRRSWTVLGGVGVAVVAIVALVSMVFARAVTKPVRDLEHAARRLGDGDLHARTLVPHGPPELVSLATEFNDTAAKLERLVDAQEEFIADASHQLRTPLTAMRLLLENMAASPGERTTDSVAALLREVHRLTRIVDGLLALARATNAPSRPVPTDVDDVVRNRVTHWSAYAEEQGVRLAVVGTGGHAASTPGNLEQALDNLVSNAIDASPRGGTVTFRLHRGADVAIDVIDEGPGMTAEQRSRAFTRFRSSGGAKKAGGYGLGLTIARQLAVIDGGDLVLTATSPSAGGLTAGLRLPLAVEGGRERAAEVPSST